MLNIKYILYYIKNTIYIIVQNNFNNIINFIIYNISSDNINTNNNIIYKNIIIHTIYINIIIQ